MSRDKKSYSHPKALTENLATHRLMWYQTNVNTKFLCQICQNAVYHNSRSYLIAYSKSLSSLPAMKTSSASPYFKLCKNLSPQRWSHIRLQHLLRGFRREKPTPHYISNFPLNYSRYSTTWQLWQYCIWKLSRNMYEYQALFIMHSSK